MSEFKPGEIVNITIKGARVVDVTKLGECELGVTFDCNFGLYPLTVPLGPAGVTVERVAPAEWPPRPGDLWRDQRGNVWFAADLHDIEETDTPAIYMLASHEDHQVVPECCNENFGPLTLVHREDEQDGGAS